MMLRSHLARSVVISFCLGSLGLYMAQNVPHAYISGDIVEQEPQAHLRFALQVFVASAKVHGLLGQCRPRWIDAEVQGPCEVHRSRVPTALSATRDTCYFVALGELPEQWMAGCRGPVQHVALRRLAED